MALPSNIQDWFKNSGTSEQQKSAKQISTWLESMGSRVSGGTSIGKSPQTLILDIKHQGSEIYINSDGEIQFNGATITNKKEFTTVYNIWKNPTPEPEQPTTVNLETIYQSLEQAATTPVMEKPKTPKKPKSQQKFYLGTRYNPQLPKPYYTAYGQLPKSEVARKEDCVYGSMSLTAYDTEKEYTDRMDQLLADGYRVHGYDPIPPTPETPEPKVFKPLVSDIFPEITPEPIAEEIVSPASDLPAKNPFHGKPEISFKTIKSTGAYSAFFEDQHIIKYYGLEIGAFAGVGTITNTKVEIRLMVEKDDIMEDKNPNCTWKWITLKAKFNNGDDAKEWLKNNIKALAQKYTFPQI